jgi:predicted ATP-grasp superfamily ATP-dependent carboligase
MQQGKFRVIVTDAEYKQSICLIKDLKSKYPASTIFGLVDCKKKLKFLPKKTICIPIVGKIQTFLNDNTIDYIIGVGANSIKELVLNGCEKSLIPTKNQFLQSINKKDLESYINGFEFYYPKTINLLDFEKDMLSLPFILKSSNETESKENTIYINTFDEYNEILVKLKNKENFIIQEKVIGDAVGYFAIFHDGVCVVDYMHKRLRQIPISGGSSTACTIYTDNRLLEKCRSFLKEKKWNGPVMLEFLISNDMHTLIEINPKFWGSFELSYCAGLSFADAYIQCLSKMPVYMDYRIHQKSIYWPLDGDIVNLFKSRNFKGFIDYFKSDSYVVLGENFTSIFYKLLWTLKKIIFK